MTKTRTKLTAERAYASLIGLFSAQCPLAGRFKVRPCFYPSSQGDTAYVSLTVLENDHQPLSNAGPPVVRIMGSISDMIMQCFGLYRVGRSVVGQPLRDGKRRCASDQGPDAASWRAWLNAQPLALVGSRVNGRQPSRSLSSPIRTTL